MTRPAESIRNGFLGGVAGAVGVRAAGVALSNPLGAAIVTTSVVASSCLLSETARREVEICREYAQKNCVPNRHQTSMIAGVFGLTMAGLFAVGSVGYLPAMGGMYGARIVQEICRCKIWESTES